MSTQTTVKQIMQSPQVLGFVHCDESGDVLVQEGNEVDVLSNVMIYFLQIAGLIGESLGLEDFFEAQIQGKSLHVICLPHEGGGVGVILNSKSKTNEITSQLQTYIQEL